MRPSRTLLAVLLTGIAALLLGSTGPATALVINFDTDPNGAPVPSGAIVDSLYASVGVTFNWEGPGLCTGPHVFANNNQPPGFGSPPNVVSTCAPPIASDINASDLGIIHALLSQPADQVCVDVRPDGATDFGTLRVFDFAGSQIASASSTLGVTGTICASAAGIRGARFAGGSSSAFARFDNFSVTFTPGTCSPGGSPPVTDLVASILPSSRSVRVGTPATAFATIINAGTNLACGVGISLATGIPADFTYNATDCASNAVIGGDNTPVNIAPGGQACFVVSITPTAAFAPAEVGFSFKGSNTTPVATLVAINTLLASASAGPVPDLVALAATINNDGIVHVPGPPGTGVFSVATANVGSSDSITASANTGGVALPVTIALCQTDPGTGVCISPITSSVPVQVNAGATPTFGVFVTATGAVPFDPATNRIFVVFSDSGNVVRGRTSVAVRSP